MMGRPRLSQLFFFLLGGLTTCTFAPFGLALLLAFLPLPLFLVCLTTAPRDAARCGFWYGFGLFLTGTYWIYISVAIFGNAPIWIALALMLGLVLIMAVYYWLAAWLMGWLSGGSAFILIAVAPCVWVLLEWLRGWVLTGFPWMAFGYSQIDTWLSGWAPLLGVYGVSAMLILSSAALLGSMLARGRQRILALIVAAVPWLAGAGLGGVEWASDTGSPIRATLIQGGISQDRKWLPEQREPTMRFYREATRKAAASALVVWPEVAVPMLTDRAASYIESLSADTALAGQTLLFGILERQWTPSGESRVYNSLLLVAGDQRQVYRKRHLVPFGEYFPVPPSVREWLRMMNLPFSDISAGRAKQPLLTTRDGVRLAVAICYEDAYGAEQLYAMPEAELLINVSNDAWFGDSIAPHQHLQIARMRSLEVHREAIRATNTGISAFIGAHGELFATGPQFEPAIMERDVQPKAGSTPYSRFGNLPVVLLSLVVLGGFWLRARAS